MDNLLYYIITLWQAFKGVHVDGDGQGGKGQEILLA